MIRAYTVVVSFPESFVAEDALCKRNCLTNVVNSFGTRALVPEAKADCPRPVCCGQCL